MQQLSFSKTAGHSVIISPPLGPATPADKTLHPQRCLSLLSIAFTPLEFSEKLFISESSSDYTSVINDTPNTSFTRGPTRCFCHEKRTPSIARSLQALLNYGKRSRRACRCLTTVVNDLERSRTQLKYSSLNTSFINKSSHQKRTHFKSDRDPTILAFSRRFHIASVIGYSCSHYFAPKNRINLSMTCEIWPVM